MRWPRIVGLEREQPEKGSYSDWKAKIAEHCWHRCVYCALGEGGSGERHFHVEHFRPKKIFPELTDVMTNLYYACSICNGFKGSDWPAEPKPELSEPSYADPSQFDYNDHINVSGDWELESELPAFLYMIERLFLNRAQLITARRASQVVDSIIKRKEELVELLVRAIEGPAKIGADLMVETVHLNEALTDLVNSVASVRPYSREDVRRP